MNLKSKLMQSYLEKSLRQLIIKTKMNNTANIFNSFKDFLIFFEREAFAQLQRRLAQKGIPTSTNYYPEFSALIAVYSQVKAIPCWKQISQSKNCILKTYFITIQNLTNHLQLTEFLIRLYRLWKANLACRSKIVLQH